ncbi:uncharacterized protein LOC125629684 [Caretta caretta]|uniref:uncharacterized protein LOC125629684 n=1 Tax=Caretta caretta TaxID=8467 RepID=UPI003F4C671A
MGAGSCGRTARGLPGGDPGPRAGPRAQPLARGRGRRSPAEAGFSGRSAPSAPGISRPGPRGDKSDCGALRWLRAEPSPAAQHQPPPPARTMSRPRSFALGRPLLLLLLLLLLAACAALCRGAPMAGELRCQCVQTVSAVIPPKRIALVELIPEGPHCGVPEIIATTKQGKKICLEPSAPWVKLIVTKILSSKSNKL